MHHKEERVAHLRIMLPFGLKILLLSPSSIQFKDFEQRIPSFPSKDTMQKLMVQCLLVFETKAAHRGLSAVYWNFFFKFLMSIQTSIGKWP